MFLSEPEYSMGKWNENDERHFLANHNIVNTFRQLL